MAKEKEKGFNWVIIYRGRGGGGQGSPADFMFLCFAAFLVASEYLIPPPDVLSPAPPGQKDEGRKGGGVLSHCTDRHRSHIAFPHTIIILFDIQTLMDKE